jgi:hypothetical protein
MTEHEQRAQTMLREYAGGEPVTVEIIAPMLYAFGSELACLRIFAKYNANGSVHNKHVRVGYSPNMESWYASVDNVTDPRSQLPNQFTGVSMPHDAAKVALLCVMIKDLRPTWNPINEEFQGVLFVKTNTPEQGDLCICFGGSNDTFGASVYKTAESGEDAGYIDTGVPTESADLHLLAESTVKGVELFLKTPPPADGSIRTISLNSDSTSD